MNRRTHRHMKDNGQTALSRQTDVAIFALPIIVPSEEVCDARGDAMKNNCRANKFLYQSLSNNLLFKVHDLLK